MKVQINGFLTYRNAFGREQFDFLTYNPTQFDHNDRVVIREEVVEFEVPDNFDPRPAQIEMLKAQQAKVRAQMLSRINELQEQINKLLAIEMAMGA